MRSFILGNEIDATNLVVTMGQIIQKQGLVTVGQVLDLLGFSHSRADNQLCWRSTTHTLSEVEHGNFSLDLPDPEPIDFRNESAPVRPAPETIRIVFEIENRTGIAGEQDILDAFDETRLRLMARTTSFNKRPSFAPGPRVRYGRSFGEDDI